MTRDEGVLLFKCLALLLFALSTSLWVPRMSAEHYGIYIGMGLGFCQLWLQTWLDHE